MNDEAPPPHRHGVLGVVVAIWDGLYSFVFRVVPLLLAAAFVLLLLREIHRAVIEKGAHSGANQACRSGAFARRRRTTPA